MLLVLVLGVCLLACMVLAFAAFASFGGLRLLFVLGGLVAGLWYGFWVGFAVSGASCCGVTLVVYRFMVWFWMF